jgi:DNA-binding NarL/FixJ family response regulator
MLEKTPNRSALAGASTDPADRLLDLLSTFLMSRSDGRSLVQEIRGSLHKMRQLQSQLRKQQGGASGNNSNHTGIHLQNRYGFTHREAEVALLLAQGLSNSAIAQELRISGHTARHHTQSILSKLQVHSRAAAGARIRG